MSFVNYKNTNNANSLLIADITASQTTILITDGDQSLFPSSFPFLLTIEHLDANENVILREIVKAVSGNQNSFTVERSAGICVQDDTATNRVQDNTAHAFYSGDKISLYWTAEQVADIQNNLELKGNQDSIANVYDNTATYSIGDIVVYNGDRYICQTAVETPEEFDPTKWTKVNVQYELDDHETRIENLESAGGGNQVDILVLGGGGGGGGGGNATLKGGGGGAGELKIVNGLILRETILNVVVGNGGGGALYNGTNGGYSSFGNVVAIGGGGGGAGAGSLLCSGLWGGNGGGGGGRCGSDAYGGFGIMNTGANSCCVNGGGGGGVGGPGGEVGYLDGYSQMFRGGRGIQTNFGGVNICIGGGGAGGGFNGTGAGTFPQLAGQCYGGGVGQNAGTNGGSGTANTGGGGAGGNNSYGGGGGSGIVIVRYPKDCSYGIACATGGTITTPTIDGVEYVVHTFTSSGTFCITQTA